MHANMREEIFFWFLLMASSGCLQAMSWSCFNSSNLQVFCTFRLQMVANYFALCLSCVLAVYKIKPFSTSPANNLWRFGIFCQWLTHTVEQRSSTTQSINIACQWWSNLFGVLKARFRFSPESRISVINGRLGVTQHLFWSSKFGCLIMSNKWWFRVEK